jgi:flagellar hook-associated protein 3 FlgL
MRISTFNAYQSSIDSLQKRQSRMQTAQEQLTTGKRVARPSDDPTAAARAERAMVTLSRNDAHQRAVDAARTNTQLTESALGDATELIQQARETLLQAGNGSYTDNERGALAQQLTGLRQQLLLVANRADGAGRHLFGGQGGSIPPFADTPAGVVYQGVAGDTKVASAYSLAVSIDGANAWLEAPAAVSGDPPLSVFDVLDKAIVSLNTAGSTNDDVSTTVQTGVRDLDAVLNHQLSVRAKSGEALNRMDMADLTIANGKLAAETERSNAEDMDMVQGISDFENQQTGYSAALQAYSMVKKLSLFDYIG